MVIVSGQRHGLSSTGIGVLLAAFGSCILAGSLLSPIFRRTLSVRAILLLELWTGLGIAAFLIWPNVYVLDAAHHGAGNHAAGDRSVVEGYRLAVTPDRLLGRSESARSTISLLAAPLAARRRLPAEHGVGPRHGRGLRHRLTRTRALGHAEPVDPQRAESRRPRLGAASAGAAPRRRFSPVSRSNQ